MPPIIGDGGFPGYSESLGKIGRNRDERWSIGIVPYFSQSVLGASLYSLASSFRPDEEAALIIRLLGGGD
jgi:hypothetical protein